MYNDIGRLYSIPEHHGLVATEFVYRHSGKEASMDIIGRIIRYFSHWTKNHALALSLVFSALNIGLAYFQTRDSGTTDQLFEKSDLRDRVY